MNKSLWHALGTALSCRERWHQRLQPPRYGTTSLATGPEPTLGPRCQPVLHLQQKTGSSATLRVGLGATQASCARKVKAWACSGIKASWEGFGVPLLRVLPFPAPLGPATHVPPANQGVPQQRGALRGSRGSAGGFSSPKLSGR